MDITTHNQIEFKLKIEENSYSFSVPHGVQIAQAVDACGFFMSAFMKMKKEHEEKEKKEETTSEPSEPTEEEVKQE